jgi:hypothetical protein
MEEWLTDCSRAPWQRPQRGAGMEQTPYKLSEGQARTALLPWSFVWRMPLVPALARLFCP